MDSLDSHLERQAQEDSLIDQGRITLVLKHQRTEFLGLLDKARGELEEFLGNFSPS